MNHEKFFTWCRIAVKGIKYRPERDQVHKELYEHLEDRYESFRSRGCEQEEAVDKTIEAMGSAEDLSVQLAAIYRPFWPYTLLISRCLLILVAVLLAISFVRFLSQGDITEPNFENFYPMCDYNAYTDTAYKTDGAEGSRLLYLEPEVSASIDGYKVAVKKVALWQCQYGEKKEDQLHIQLEVKNLWPWAEPLRINKLLEAEDSLGNRYVNVHKALNSHIPLIDGVARRTGMFTYTYELYLDNYISQNADWIDLRYEREGRNLRLRLNLAGGAER